MIVFSIKKFFSEGHHRTLNAKKNIIKSFVWKGISIGVSFLLVPLTIGYVNPTRYGIWLTLSSIIAWFSFFDIGFSNSLRNKFAESKATNNFQKAKAYISTIYASLAIIFSIVWGLFFFANKYIDWAVVLNTPPEMRHELSQLAMVVFSFFCLQFILKTISTVILADQQPAKAAFYDMLGQVISLGVIFLLTKTTSNSLIFLGMAIGGAPIVVLIMASIVLYSTDYNKFAPSISSVDFGLIRDILDLGVKFFIIQIASIVIYQTNNIVITQVCGPQEVTIYNIAYKYFGMLTMGFSIVIAPFWSAYTEAQALRDYQWMRNIHKKLKMAWLFMAIIASIFLVLSSLIYKLWIRDQVVIPFSVSSFVFVYVLIFNWCAIFSQILSGLGKVKIMLYSAIIGCVINIPIAYSLGKIWGIIGVVSSSIILSAFAGIWAPFQVNLVLNKKAKGIWNE